jgi:two-component system cell cycle sensor histidine kinase/response regulator CckA
MRALSERRTGRPADSASTEAESALRERVAELEAELAALEQGRVDPQQALREALLRQLEQIAHLGSWSYELSTGKVTWSEELFRILGYDPALDTPSPELFFRALHPDDVERSRANMRGLSSSGELAPTELRVLWKDGTTHQVFSYGTVLRDERNGGVRAVGAILDVTDSRRQQREAERSARFLQEAQRVAKVGSWVMDVETGLLDWSNELADLFGVPQGMPLNAENFRARIHPDDRAQLGAYRQLSQEAKAIPSFEMRVIRADGETRHLLVYSAQLPEQRGAQRYIGTALDITERKQLEEQLRQSQKMEIVGRMAGGVAHDFNNLLTVIAGNADLMLETSGGDERAARIRDAAEVGAALTKQLLAFSRQAVVKTEPIDLNEAIREFTRIADRLIGAHVSIKLELSSTPVVVLADRGQVQQILLNLAVNARDAMARGGDLLLFTRELSGESGRSAELTVKDTGKGMDEATRRRALEPFFTTKEPGQGTGLGLSTIADVVQQMKGTISINSELERGTIVTMHFPLSELPGARSVPAPEQAKTVEHAKSILLVEDNGELRELLALFLRSAGHRVQAVGRPSEAELAWKNGQRGFDLLITDMVMPEKSGKLLAQQFQQEKPRLLVLFISGYTPDRDEFGAAGFLQKPFTRAELLRAVAAMLEARLTA